MNNFEFFLSCWWFVSAKFRKKRTKKKQQKNENNKHPLTLTHRSKRKVGIFTQFLFFSHAATTALCGKLGLSQNRCDSQSIYQFEARYFQYSVLAKNIRFCKDYRTNNNNNNSSNNSNGISYMIFKFGKVSQVTGTELYAICVENNRPKQQPWICQHILTLDEMLKYFNLHKQALNVREGFLNAMRIESNCVSKVFDTDCECRAQIPKIWRTLNHGYKQYVRDMANKNINTNSNCLCGENFSGWFNDDLVSTRSNNSTNSNNSNISSNYSSSSSISDTWSVIANLGRIKSVSVDSDSNSVCSSCGSSRSSTISAISRRRKCGKSGNGRKGGKGSKGSKGSKGDREGKIKNEDKFCFLESICSELGFSLCDDENFNHLSKALLGVLSRAIENAIKFAQKYPDTVLTQAYIDEENGFITYELVLIAEIINKKMNKYYKFAVPIAEQINSNGDKYYKAENILTPKMVVDNVRLNSENARFKKGTWIADINDITKSFYKQVDKTWYLNATSSSSSSSLVSNDDETKEYESLSVEDGDDIDNSTDNSDYDKQKFYQIGLNIHTGSKNVSQRNNRPKHNNRQGSFKYNNNNNDHYNRRRHGSNSMYNNCNNYNYNYNYNYDNHNNYDNYDYYNDCSTNYDNMNNSHFNHQCQQNSFGW